ncbi:tetratricopeptide repeat protein [Nannocystis pusilla]|uniref:Tetratricopeptide repeat protein n=1 Tax=Nannocystis pusilla TaxID=889268 RepID=A0ABS7U4T3_9BACT|nr:tetratricopeptide repeat protein [Nannocystis pusilla]MBZ5715459.1 tetratricopeptide repeat protein [Nannocystis pusilla]
MAGPKHSELPAVVVPQHLWLRSARPVQGKAVQWAVPGVLIVVGLLMSSTALRVSFVLAGFGVFLLLPGLVTSRLEQLGREVLAADRSRAGELLKELPERPIVRLFAPAGWRSLQTALLNLKLGDGHAAAAGFAETAELCGQPEAVMLISAQAHAHVLAGERTKARELLQKLTQANLLGPRDQLDLGIVLLIESKKFKQALSYIEAARKTIGEHPRIVAAQALALQKLERIDEASVLLEQVQIAIKDAATDTVTDDLIKRARKGLQDYLEAQLRRERRARSRRTTIVVSSEAAASEIVSGEISGGGEPTATEAGMNDARSESEPMRRFASVESPTPPAPAPAPVAAPPKAAPPAERDPDAPRPGLEIDLFSAPHTSAPPLSELLKDRSEDSKPRIDSVAAALASEVPAAAPVAPPSLIVPDIGSAPMKGAAPVVPAPRVGGTMPFTPSPPVVDAKPASEKPAPRATSLFMAGPAVTPPAPAPEVKPDSDAPVVRRRQTLLGVLPTNEPNKPPAPSLPSLNSVGGPPPPAGAPFAPAMPRTGLPTRGTTRLDLPAIGSPPPNPAGPAPVFRAPPKPGAPKSDDKKE